MIRSVKLDELPGEVGFPSELQDRIQYDAKSKQLRFQGFMSKTDFDKLSPLWNDYRYQRAIEELFQICTFEVEETAEVPRRSWTGLVLSLAAGFALALAAGWWWYQGVHSRHDVEANRVVSKG